MVEQQVRGCHWPPGSIWSRGTLLLRPKFCVCLVTLTRMCLTALSHAVCPGFWCEVHVDPVVLIFPSALMTPRLPHTLQL